MNKIALVWKDPEGVSIYTFDTKRDKNIVEFCRDAHGYFSTDNAATAQLNALLRRERPVFSSDGSKQSIIGPFLDVYVSGVF